MEYARYLCYQLQPVLFLGLHGLRLVPAPYYSFRLPSHDVSEAIVIQKNVVQKLDQMAMCTVKGVACTVETNLQRIIT